MDVVGVAVVSGADAHDRPQLLRRVGSDLQAVETTPRDADHPHLPAAPRLRRKPADDLDAVVLLERQVLVLENAVRITRAPEIDTDSRVSVTSEIAVHCLIVYRVIIVLAIRNVLKDRRNRMIWSIFREPNPCSQTATIRHWDPRVIYNADPRGKVISYIHARL